MRTLAAVAALTLACVFPLVALVALLSVGLLAVAQTVHLSRDSILKSSAFRRLRDGARRLRVTLLLSGGVLGQTRCDVLEVCRGGHERLSERERA